MRLCVAFIIVLGLNTTTQAETLSPWFGSEASAPIQLGFANSDPLTVDSTQVSAADVKIICPIEGCPTEVNFGKQPE